MRTFFSVVSFLIVVLSAVIGCGQGADAVMSHGSIIGRLVDSQDCDPTYGFLPCTMTLWGNVFLIGVYGYLMFLAAKMLSNGSEILLQILGPGIIGGLFLPILSSLPDATIILASGLSGSTESAQSQVSVGMGLLAGSTVYLLTLLWGTCVIVGKCDIVNKTAVDGKDTKLFSLTGSGVTTDVWTSHSARIMMISVVPFLIVQIPQAIGSSSISRAAVLAAFVVSICLFLAYSLYQILQPRIQKRKIAYAMHKRVISGIIKQLKTNALGGLINEEGKPNTIVIEQLFAKLDENSDGFLSAAELKALIVGIQFEEFNVNVDNAVSKVMEEFDKSQDSLIDVNEFTRGISRWLNKAKRSALRACRDGSGSTTTRLLCGFDKMTDEEEQLLMEQEDEVETADVENVRWQSTKAVSMLLLGTLVAAVIANPLVDTVDNFSAATGIPSFFVSFVILPFASSSEAVSGIIFASRKKKRTISLTYSEIYGSVTMSNVLSLAVFLGLVYARGLSWDFFSEVVVMVIVCVVMGGIASCRTTFPLWMSFMAYVFYPFSLGLVYVLDYVLNLS